MPHPTLARPAWPKFLGPLLALGVAVQFVSGSLAPVTAQERPEPVSIDDREFLRTFANRLGKLAKAGKCLAPAKIAARLKRSRCTLPLVEPDRQLLTPEEVYQKALRSTVVIGSVEYINDKRPRWEDVSMGTAWVLSPDGILVTNCHVLQDIRDEHFGVCTYDGRVYPLVDILACDPVEDLAIIKVDAEDLVPLPVEPHEPVGAWVGVLSHPADAYYTYTQGTITRYNSMRERRELTHWMSITAEFAYGSSGGPVLNRKGNVVGVATMTTAVVYPSEEEIAKNDSPLQMVVKGAVPISRLLQLVDRQPDTRPASARLPANAPR